MTHKRETAEVRRAERETLADPRNDRHASMLEWLGLETTSEFDPAAFDLAEVNAVL